MRAADGPRPRPLRHLVVRDAAGGVQGGHAVLVVVVANAAVAVGVVTTDALLVLLLGRDHGGGEAGLLAELLAKQVEANGDGNAQGGEAAEQRGGPLDAEAVEHLAREQGEAGGGDGAEKGVGGNGGGGAGKV